MTMWLLVLLFIVVAAAVMWLSQRRRIKAHPGTRFGDLPAEGVWSKVPWHGGH